MSKKNTTVPGRVAGFLGENSYIIVFVAIFIVYALTTNGLTWSGMMNVFRHSAVIGIIGLGMGLICITGEIDLSVGSMLALDGGFSVIIFNMTNSIVLTFLFAVLFGAFCGLINGVMVGWIQMPAFIVTLATMLIYRSFAQYFCQHVNKALIGGGSSVYKMANSQSSYQTLYNFGNGKVSTIPIVGNQQKVFLARWLNTDAEILLLDNPTQGIDVGAKAEIYKLILELAKQGKTILINTLEIPEIQKVADYCAVFYNGEIIKILEHQEIDEMTVMMYSTNAAQAEEGK